jgi:carboxyl-terminal processing protease
LKVTVAKYYIPSGRCIQKVDYAHHDSTGKAVVKADSLIRNFKTRNGRPVIDGRGIAPDVMVTEPEMPKVVGGLFLADAFFDFANQYRWTHDSIAAPEKFVITDAIWNEFVAFVKNKDLKYQTETMDELAKLEATAKRERYYDHAKAAIETLRAEIKPERDEDMRLFRKDIEEILRAEIVGRFYYQTGRAKSMLVTDPYVLKAIDVLNGPEYTGILSGAVKPGN